MGFAVAGEGGLDSCGVVSVVSCLVGDGEYGVAGGEFLFFADVVNGDGGSVVECGYLVEGV